MTTTIANLLLSARRVLGCRVIFRDYLDLAKLEDDLRWRVGTACQAVKASPDGLAACRAFCARQVVREVSLLPEGRQHTCPFGHTEIVVPVIVDGRSFGQLIAGPWWTGPGRPPRAGLPLIDAERRADLTQMLLGLAQRCAQLAAMSLEQNDDRRGRILRLLEQRYGEDLSLAEVAVTLRLSTSRCGHLVQECFGRTFPALLREVRLNHATRLLLGSDKTVSDIATRCGFRDASYFARVFRATHGCTPATFRARPSQDSA